MLEIVLEFGIGSFEGFVVKILSVFMFLESVFVVILVL